MSKDIFFKGPVVKGTLELDEAVLLSVPQKAHYNEVDLAFKCEGMNAGFGVICSDDLDYENKVKLGNEIEKRWNDYQKAKEILSEIESADNGQLTITSELKDRIKQII